MPGKKKISPKHLKMIDSTLEAIIDQWYLSVSDYYVTAEKKAENPALEQLEELKRFHDDNGHRIKFAKGDLDFTYGLSLNADTDHPEVEASVNNKVPNFDYGELLRRLSAYYSRAASEPIEGFKKLKKLHNCDVFSLPKNLQNSLTVEQREGKADIIRLSFGLLDDHLDELIAEPPNFMEVVHQYCVAPLRRVYAEVFRAKRTR